MYKIFFEFYKTGENLDNRHLVLKMFRYKIVIDRSDKPIDWAAIRVFNVFFFFYFLQISPGFEYQTSIFVSVCPPNLFINFILIISFERFVWPLVLLRVMSPPV